jgi:D-amino-acid dehydrogenase
MADPGHPVVASGDPIVVIGGGIVGLSCAWFLHRAGADVIVLEAGDRTGQGASRGNAGAVCPSMVEPLAAPGVLRTILDDLRSPDAALHVHPGVMPQMAGFLLRFRRAATPRAYERAMVALIDLGRGVMDAYDELEAAGVDAGLRRDGYVTAHADERGAAEEHVQIARIAAEGLCMPPGPILPGEEIRRIEPLLSDRVVAGFQIPGEGWVDAGVVVDALTGALEDAGVDVRTQAPARTIADLGDGVEVDTPGGTVDAAAAVVSAGAWSRELVAHFGVKLPLYPGKGYSFSILPAVMPRHVLHLPDAHVMCTPYERGLRVAGTMEFDGTMDRFNPGRIEAIVRAAAPYLDDVDWAARTDAWVGPRPITPDGLPVLGSLSGHARVVFATGHNMLGVTFAPVTGRLIARLLVEGEAGIDLAPFSPSRF